jgi:hypothetical protein
MSSASRVLLYGEAVCDTVATIARTPSIVVHGVTSIVYALGRLNTNKAHNK